MSVIAILMADIHLSLKAPRCRSAEKDWKEVQRRQLREVCELQATYNCPVLCSGDVFDHWNAPAELIRFALDELPERLYCVAGNHDLPYHDLGQLERSAYGVLCSVGKIIDVSKPVMTDERLRIVGFPWGVPMQKNKPHTGFRGVNVAVVHAYVWCEGTGYPGAAEDAHYLRYAPYFKEYDAVLLGDNHKTWQRKNTLNPGSFFRRTIDDGPPTIGLLRDDGKIKAVELKTPGRDLITGVDESSAPTDDEALYVFLDSLRRTPDAHLDFRKEVEQYILNNKPAPETARILRKALEGAGGK